VGRLLLWDVDGTLIRGGGVGSDAINRAAAAVAGKPVNDVPVMMHGKTDPSRRGAVPSRRNRPDSEIAAPPAWR